MDWQWKNYLIVSITLIIILPFSINETFAQTIDEDSEVTNNPPVIGVIENQAVNELTELSFVIPATDEDGDDLLFSLSEPSQGATLDESTGEFRWTPTEEQGPASGAGMYMFEVTVSDGEDSDSQMFFVTVYEVNSPPYFTSSPTVDAAEDEPYSYEITVDDSDTPPQKLLIGAKLLPTWMKLESNMLTGTPSMDEVGKHDVVLGVTDNVVMVEQSFTINVELVNDSPVIGVIENQIVDELIELTFVIPATDEDGDDLLFSLDGPDVGATIDESTGEFSWTPSEEDGPATGDGMYEFEVTVSDGIESDSASFLVQVNEVNSPPSFTSSPTLDAAEDFEYSYEVTFEDSDIPIQELQLEIVSIPSWLSLKSNILSGTPLMEDIGEHDVVLSVSDSVDLTEQEFTIKVSPTNDAPVIVSEPIETIIQEENYSYTVIVDDEDGDDITISTQTLPSWLNFVDNGDGTATLSGIPNLSDLGQHEVTIEATDGELSDSQSFTIEVLGAQDLIDQAIQELNDDPEFVPENLGTEVSKMANLLHLLAGADKATHAEFIEKFHQYKADLKQRLGIGQGKLNSLEHKKQTQELDGIENSLKIKSTKLLDKNKNQEKIKTAIDYTQQKKALIKLQNHAGVIKYLLLESDEKNKILEELKNERMKLLKNVIIQEAKHHGKQLTSDDIKKIDEKVKEKTSKKKSVDRVSDPKDNGKKNSAKDKAKEKSNNGKSNGKGNGGNNGNGNSNNNGKGNSNNNGKGNSK